MVKRNRLPTKDELLHIFDYRDGVLFWKNPTGRSVKRGDRAGSFDGRYYGTSVKGKPTRIHRIVYKMFFGVEPLYVDHINEDKTDNRIENLQAIDHTQNLLKGRKRSDNKSGKRGVFFDNRSKKWDAKICLYGKRIYLGQFKKLSDAIKAREDAEKRYITAKTEVSS